ncbi:autotransporter domain-containing protein [Sulfurimonas sp.]|uniref:autotransporter domain-containing protein n=1 Tax=Sulfurimonas sp. TaxID=2022749 RepID=UPI002B4A1D35|nr:autotransporter domain-containing protein [Sulfurimonas sp.]
MSKKSFFILIVFLFSPLILSGIEMKGLGDLGGSFSQASGVNSDGSVVVGNSKSASNNTEAFRWTQAGGMVDLGDLGGGHSKVKAVNSDGSVVVGNSKSTNDATEAFRWTQAGGMVGLGYLAGGVFFSKANAVNSDGSVVVGVSKYTSGHEAFRWTQETGMQSLTKWLQKSGYTLSGWSKTSATGVSADGRVIVGYGTSSNGREAFIARGGSGLPDGGGLIGLSTLTMSLSSIANVNVQGMSILNTTMHGAHGHPGSNRASDDKYTMWTAGDFAYNDRYETKDNFYLAEVGFGYRQNDYVRYSMSYGQTTGASKLLYEGKNKIDGYFFVIEADIRLPIELPIYTTLSYMYGKNDLDIKRGYENAGSLDYSEAKTDQNMQAFRLRVQGQSEKDYIYPYVEYNYASVTTDAYTEINGGFPASFNKNKENTNDIRVGFDSNFKLNEKNRVITSLEGIHRMEKESNGISGTVIGFSSFHLAKETYKQNWIKATVGIESTFNVGKFTLTLNSTSKSADPQYWVGANYSLFF